ncbi:MAG: hypothetical protein V4548_02360 [Bacteroidota bacterium]
MKYIKTLLILAVLFTANTTSAQSVFEKWPSIAAFHEVIAQTFHPAEEGNLKPIKERSEEVMIKAAAVLKNDIPAEFRTDTILKSAEKLQVKSKYLHKLVTEKAPNEIIVKSITDLHDTFHEIVGLCRPAKTE